MRVTTLTALWLNILLEHDKVLILQNMTQDLVKECCNPHTQWLWLLTVLTVVLKSSQA